MRSKAPLILGILAGAAIIVVVAVLAVVRPWQAAPGPGAGAPDASTPSASAPPVLDPSTHILDDAGPDAPVVVEFLDFECEACGAVFPIMEQLREDYAGQVTFAIRYFPLPGHFNSTNAALAAQAAAEQGQLEAMYQRLFETQTEWGEQQVSEADRFRGYAEELGLDMAAYDAAIVSQETSDRVQFDFDAAVGLGLQGTPGIFVDGEELQLQYTDDIENAIEAALAE